MVRRCNPMIWFAAALFVLSASAVQAEPRQLDTIKDVFAKLRACWKPPPPWRANPNIDITAIVSFTRDGNILGRPRITHESEQASDNDRLLYRVAVMQTLQRCTPMPFTEGLGGAIAGRPFAVRFWHRRNLPQPTEKRAWLTQTTL